MSIKLSKAIGTSATFWLNLQQDYELSQYDQDDYEDIEKLSA
jgi:antitoxin HigA-1